MMTSDYRNMIDGYQSLGYGLNLSYKSSKSGVPWAMMFDDPVYKSQVGLYEGGWDFEKGVWRSSETSLMSSSWTGGFNAWSRYLIYSNVALLSGEEPSFAFFKEAEALP